MQGAHPSGKSQGNLFFLQGQGKVREFWKMVREFLEYENVREKSGNFENHALFKQNKSNKYIWDHCYGSFQVIIRGESSILIDICVFMKSIRYSTFIIIDHKHGLNLKLKGGCDPCSQSYFNKSVCLILQGTKDNHLDVYDYWATKCTVDFFFRRTRFDFYIKILGHTGLGTQWGSRSDYS